MEWDLLNVKKNNIGVKELLISDEFRRGLVSLFKYFILNALATVIMVVGLSLLYLHTGKHTFSDIGIALTSSDSAEIKYVEVWFPNVACVVEDEAALFVTGNCPQCQLNHDKYGWA